MKYNVNPGKKPAIAACGKIFLRLPLRTHFVKIGEALPPVGHNIAAAPREPLQGKGLKVVEHVNRLPSIFGGGASPTT